MPSSNTVQTLQTALQAKAKAEPTFRFYSLWDKIFRQDVLREAYRRCRANHGAPGVDGVSFAQIEERGAESWLGEVRQELLDRDYRPPCCGYGYLRAMVGNDRWESPRSKIAWCRWLCCWS